MNPSDVMLFGGGGGGIVLFNIFCQTHFAACCVFTLRGLGQACA